MSTSVRRVGIIPNLLLGTTFCWGSAGALFAGSGGWIEFENETSTRLIAEPLLGVSDPEEKDYAWGDIDNDGDIDLVCVRKQGWTTPGRRRNVLFMNEGIAQGHPINGVLVDRTNQYATEANDGGQGFLDLTNDRDVALTDVNLDGWLDMVTATTLSEGLPKTISHPRVYMNKGAPEGVWLGFRYEEQRFPQLRQLPTGPNVSPRFCSVSAGDVTGDGYPDLYFGEYDQGGFRPIDVNDRLLINDGQGNFTDSGHSRMTPAMLQSSFGMATAIVDMNGDGWADIVKDTALDAPTRVNISYNNPANPGYFNAIETPYSGSPYHVTVGDLNQDNRPDMIITDDGSDRYLLNLGNGPDGRADFSTRTYSFTGGGFDDGFGGDSLVVDLNNDGFNDVVITDVDVDAPACDRRLHIYRNLGDLPSVTLQEQGGALPWTPTGVHDIAIFDLNGDGWNDMVIGRCNSTQIWINQPPIGLTFGYPNGLPGFVPPADGITFRVRFTGVGTAVPIPNSGVLHLAQGSGQFESIPMNSIGEDLYEAALPPSACTSTYRWYVSGDVEGGLQFTDPPAGAAGPYVAIAALGNEITLRDEIEGDVSAWTVVNEGVLAGAWEQATPNGTLVSSLLAAPNSDATAAGDAVKAFVTKNGALGEGASVSDVDGGPTYLISPTIDLAGTDGTISYHQWFFCQNTGVTGTDYLTVEVSNDNGQQWTQVRSVSGTNSTWQVDSFQVGDYVTPTGQVRVRFGVSDTPNNSITEAGIDNFQVASLVCGTNDIEIVSSNPPDGAIDARQPSNVDGTNPVGWSEFELTFDGDATGLHIEDFSLSQDGGTQLPPVIIDVTSGSNNTVVLTLDHSVAVGAWSTITHIASGTSTRVGFLPADVNGDGVSSPVDILDLIDALNGVSSLPIYATDIDRSGQSNPADVLREIDLLNGADAYDVYNGATLP